LRLALQRTRARGSQRLTVEMAPLLDLAAKVETLRRAGPSTAASISSSSSPASSRLPPTIDIRALREARNETAP